MNESLKEKEKSDESDSEKKIPQDKDNNKEQDQEEINNFSIGGKIVFNDFKINLYSKYILNHNPENNALKPSSLISFSHQVTPWMKYSLEEQKGALKFITSMSPITNFLLSTKINYNII